MFVRNLIVHNVKTYIASLHGKRHNTQDNISVPGSNMITKSILTYNYLHKKHTHELGAGKGNCKIEDMLKTWIVKFQ